MKSAWSVIVGVVFIVAVTTVVDAMMYGSGLFPPLGRPLSDRLSLVALSYRIVIGVVGGWLTAKVAPNRPMKHAMILGYVGTVLGLVGVVATWNLGWGPRWYPIALAVLAIPQCWAGGRLFERSREETKDQETKGPRAAEPV